MAAPRTVSSRKGQGRQQRAPGRRVFQVSGHQSPEHALTQNTTNPKSFETLLGGKSSLGLVNVAEFDAPRSRSVDNEGGVRGERSGVEGAAIVKNPAVLLSSIGKDKQVRQRVQGQRVVQLPVDGPGRQRQRAQVSLVEKGLGTLEQVETRKR